MAAQTILLSKTGRSLLVKAVKCGGIIVGAGAMMIGASFYLGSVDPEGQWASCTPGEVSTSSGVFEASGGGQPNQSIARIALAYAQSQGVSDVVKLALFETGIVESGFHNLATPVYPITFHVPGFPPDNPGDTHADHDSVGFLQQRPQSGWGPPDKLMDPAYATNKFIAKAVKAEREAQGTSQAYSTLDDAGRLAQKVQVSAYGAKYGSRDYGPNHEDYRGRAEALLAGLNGLANPGDGLFGTTSCAATSNGQFAPGETVTISRYAGTRSSNEPQYSFVMPQGPRAMAINAALDQVKAHLPYVFGGGHDNTAGNPSCPGTGCAHPGLDCSTLMHWSYKAAGFNWPAYYTADAEENYVRSHGRLVSKSEAIPGDLLFFDWDSDGNIDHVGMYLGVDTKTGQDLMVHTNQTGDWAKVQDLNSGGRPTSWGQLLPVII